MTPQDIAQAAESLVLAEQSRKQIGLLSVRYPEMTLDDAYAVQKAFVERKVDGGARVVGWKIGLTSRAMQDALKITTPDSGVLLHDMVFFDGDLVPKARFIQPRVEAEIAFLMKTPLDGANVSRADVVAATEFVAPSLEILDTRILRSDPTSGRARIITDTVADNAANAGIVLGKQRHVIGDHDLRWVGAVVKRDGIVEETGLGAGVLDDPVLGIVWLVRRLAAYGQGIAAGDLVLSGSFIRPLESPPGSRINADFGQFGSVSIRFD